MLIEVGQSCPLDAAFMLGWVGGIALLFVGAWVVIYSWREGLKKYCLNQDDATKRDIMDRLTKIENELDYLEKKTNTKYCKWRHNGFVDLISHLRKQNL